MIPEEIRRQALENLMLMSRTAHGVVDVSSSAGKKDLMLVTDGKEAADRAKKNYLAAIEYAWEQREAPLESPEKVRETVEALASLVNRGLLREGRLIRNEDSPKHPYMPVRNLEAEMQWFYGALWKRLRQEPGDPAEAAAFAEYELNIRGHFFADGCGKCSIVSAAWILFRGKHSLPVYRGGYQAYYQGVPDFAKTVGPFTAEEAAAYDRYLAFYRDLFEEKTEKIQI